MFPLLIVLIIPLIVIAQTSPEVQDCPGRERWRSEFWLCNHSLFPHCPKPWGRHIRYSCCFKPSVEALLSKGTNLVALWHTPFLPIIEKALESKYVLPTKGTIPGALERTPCRISHHRRPARWQPNSSLEAKTIVRITRITFLFVPFGILFYHVKMSAHVNKTIYIDLVSWSKKGLMRMTCFVFL